MIARITDWFKKTDRKKIYIGVGALAILLVLYLLFSGAGRAQQAAAGSLQTAVVERGSLTATIGATGTVRAIQSATLAWGTSGIVNEILVAVGDEVAQDEILATLELTSMPQSIILAQADLQSAQDALEDFESSFGDLGLAEAQKAVADAQNAVESAERYLSSISNPGKQVDIDRAQANLALAQDRLDKARDDYEPYADKPETNLTRANFLLRFTQAQQEYDAALRQYNSFTSGAGATSIAQAQADLAVAQAQLAEAQQDYDEVLDGPTAQQRAAAQARVAAAEATLKLGHVEAPFAGTITDAFPHPGDLVSAGTVAFQIDNLEHVQVDVEVSEVDINRVQIGQAAVVTLDAAPDIEYHGKVVAVAMAGTLNQGAVNFRVTVELDDADAAVRPGMTAGVNVVVTQLEDVLLVPNRAVRIVDGQRVVYVLSNNVMQQVIITLGASSETYSEVTGGDLSEGDSVVLNPPSNIFEVGQQPRPGQFIMGGSN
jgi:HlyD family secretion protein